MRPIVASNQFGSSTQKWSRSELHCLFLMRWSKSSLRSRLRQSKAHMPHISFTIFSLGTCTAAFEAAQALCSYEPSLHTQQLA